jgi:anti-anti-sigma factor
MSNGNVQYACHDDVHVLRFVGEIRCPIAPAVGRFFESLMERSSPRRLAIDLTETTLIDSTNLGQLARFANTMRASGGERITILSNREDITIVLKSMGFDGVFKLIDDSDTFRGGANVAIDMPESSRDELAEVVLAAHRALMQISADNHDKFKDMIDLLELDKPVR